MFRREKAPNLPLVRLNLVVPLVHELKQRGIKSSEVLGEFNIRVAEIFQSDRFVPATTMYTIVEKLAAISGDPCFGVHVGEKLDPWSWSPLIEAAESAVSVGDFLLRYMQKATQDTSSVTYVLKTIGDRSTFRMRRFSDAGIRPRHNDGFTIAYLLTIICRAVDDSWDGSKVVARICDPAVVPNGFMGIQLAMGDTLGPSIIFPGEWLTRSFKLERKATKEMPDAVSAAPEFSMIYAFRQTLLPHIQEFDLNAQRVAEICGFSKRTLARRMNAEGSSVRQELSVLRRERSEQMLRNTDHKIAQIAIEVGYADPAVFSRTFKHWTGQSPSQYRKEFVNRQYHS